MNPTIGLCYAVEPDDRFRLEIGESFLFRAHFEPKVKKATMYFTSREDLYGLLFHDIGRLIPFKISPDAGGFVGVSMKKVISKYLKSKRQCKDYAIKDSFMMCMLKEQVECFKAGNQSCRCVPENSFKTNFQMFPVSWNVCKNSNEYQCTFSEMFKCYFDNLKKDACPVPCKKEVYIGQKMYLNGIPVHPNTMVVEIQYSTMNTEIHEEYYLQDVYNFIGTVGGSLGLFIGFSYTGFVSNVLDYFIKDY